MQTVKIPFCGPSYKVASVNQSSQVCINWFLEQAERQSASQAMLIPTPGLRKLATIGDGPIRAVWGFFGKLYVVSGNAVYSVNTDYTYSLIGTINTDSGAMSFSNNESQVIFVDGVDIWVIVGGVLTKVTDPDAPNGVKKVDYLDGYFIFSGDGSQKFYLSNLFDGTQYDALDFASSQGSPDVLRSHVVTHRQAWFFGDNSVEVWEDTGNASFPLERSGNSFLETGVAAPLSIAVLDNTIFWLGADARGAGIVWRANGLTPVRVSDFGVEDAILSYGDVSDAFAFSYQQAGHTFYVLTFPSAEKTWVLDVATNTWHQRAYLSLNGELTRWRANCFTFVNNTHIVGDYENGNIYALDVNYASDDTREIMRVRSTVSESSNQSMVAYHRFELLVQPGVGLVSGQGSNPKVMLRWSDDGGNSWSSKHDLVIGQIGSYQTRCVKNRCGAGRQRVWEISTTDTVSVIPNSAILKIAPGVF